ncbi:MAG: flagellin FliC [Micrococcales bacterium]|nr:MAG: flagellin FliC [Micrococcales bacterium]
MGLQINNNVAAFNAYRNLSHTQGALGKNLEKLSSGFRINRAADDAAGLAISEGLRAQVGGLKQAARNAQDGVSVVQTAEGALTEVHAMLQRVRDLSVQAANDSNSAESREAIQAEITQLGEALGDIQDRTEFNGTKLLDGSATQMGFQVGSNAGDTLNVNMVDLTSVVTAVKAIDVTSAAGATAAISVVSAEITTVSAGRANLGASQNRLEHTINSLNVSIENLTASESRIRDTDMAAEMTSFSKNQILSQAGTAMLAQANQAPQGVLRLLG